MTITQENKIRKAERESKDYAQLKLNNRRLVRQIEVLVQKLKASEASSTQLIPS